MTMIIQEIGHTCTLQHFCFSVFAIRPGLKLYWVCNGKDETEGLGKLSAEYTLGNFYSPCVKNGSGGHV